MPNLIEVQKSSYDQFLQMDVPRRPARRRSGLQEVFQSVFPIKDFSERAHARVRHATSSRSRNTTSRSASSAA